MSERNANGDYGAGNQAAVSHGAYSLIRKLKDGVSFVGLALDLQEAARSELETAGAIEAMKQAYSRHAAVALYLYGILNGKDGSEDTSVALRLINELRRLNRDVFVMADQLRQLDAAFSDKTIDYEAILAAKRAQEGERG